MPQYLVTVQLPDDFDPSTQDVSMPDNIEALYAEMEAAGVSIIFRGGLTPASCAKSLRVQPNREVVITDGPYMEAKEHIGGLTIIEAPDMDVALKWARLGAIACRANGEVRAVWRPDEGTEWK
jgi:hypothetical protein